MPNGLPCPNPACTHVFPAGTLKGVGALTCPRCGKRFQFRPAAAQPGSGPRAKAVPTPTANPAPAPLPEQADAGTNSFASLGDSTPSSVQRSLARRRRSRWARWTTPAVLLGLLLGAVVAGCHLAPHLADMSLWPGPSKDNEREVVDAANEFPVPALNFRFTVPDRPWLQDLGEARPGLKAALVMKRTDPDAWLAVAARDFKTRTPRLDEVREEAVRRLENFFTDHLETEPRDEEVRLAGRPAQRLVFRGERDNAVYSGECYFFAHQGIAYWFFTWAPGNVVQDARDEFDNLRRRFALLKANRDNWSDRPAGRTFRGHQVACTLEDQGGVWEEWQPATDYDPAADLALRVKEQAAFREGGDRNEQEVAKVLLLALPGAADGPKALALARANLEKQQEALGLAVKIEPDREPDADAKIGNVRGTLARFKMQLGETKRQFVLLAVVPRADRVLVLQGECAERRRGDWEPRFLQLLEHFRLE
jgi:hypothetical protein